LLQDAISTTEPAFSITGIPPHVSQLVYLQKIIKMPEFIMENIKTPLESRQMEPDAHLTVSSMEKLLSCFKLELEQRRNSNSENEDPSCIQHQRNLDSASIFWTFSAGAYRRVPQNFQFPRGNQAKFNITWRLWLLGNPEKRWYRFPSFRKST
jgi:hypothetical protein